MARKSHPWFRCSDGWWYVKIKGKQQKLVRGRKNRQAAVDRWHELMLELASNPAVTSGDQTVASVIDAYLDHAARDLAPETHQSRTRYLQLFAEAHGFRLVKECLPIHLTQWLDGKTAWISDWTRRARRRASVPWARRAHPSTIAPIPPASPLVC